MSLGLSQARKRWQWAYTAGYISAIFTFLSGFIIKDASGRTVTGFDPYSVAGCLIGAAILAALARGIQKKSLICAATLLLLVVANGILMALDENDMQGRGIFGAVVAAVILFRGMSGIRMLKKEEKALPTLLIGLLCASSLMAGPDQSLRAFLGVRSAGITLTKISRDVPYVYALARLEKGKLVGFERVSNGSLLARKDATFEIVWGKNNGHYGYAFVAGSTSHEFKDDPIYDRFQSGSQAEGEYAIVIGMRPEFKGMTVLTGAFTSLPKDPMWFLKPNVSVEDSLAGVECAVIVLFKECRSVSESIDFMHGLKKPK